MLAYCVTRLAVALIWLYQGIVPKLIFHNADELILLTQSGIPFAWQLRTLSFVGAVELFFGLLVLLLWNSRWPLYTTALAMVAATATVTIHSPAYLISAFNAVTLNVAVASLALAALLLGSGLPTAQRCRRTPPAGEL